MLRRVTILFAVLLLLSAVVAIVAPRPEPADDPTPRTGPATTTGDGVTAAVRGVLPRDQLVRATVGDVVELSVTATGPDSASIEELGLTDGADRGAPARFSFLADRPGRFDVRLLLSEQTVGRVVVSQPRPPRRAARPERRGRESGPRSPRTTGR
ncbi:MAG: hypothetical protein ACRDLS_08585 [Solirubrobacteraceae bacterium]